MRNRYSRRVVGLGLLLAAALAAVFCAETAAVSAVPQGETTKGQPSLKIVNEAGKQTVISAEAFGKLPRKSLKAKDHTGVLTMYDGVAMVDLLRAAKTTLGKELKGPLVGNCVLVEAADKYRAVFSLVEIDPDLSAGVGVGEGEVFVLVADRKEGKAMDDKEGPYRLVVPGDKKHMRWVKQVIQISVQPVGGSAAIKNDK